MRNNIQAESVQYTPEIFLAVVGTTPQIITECLYYYYSDHYKQHRHFDVIKVITTLSGKQLIHSEIFEKPRLHELEEHLGIAGIPFSPDDIILFHDIKGNSISDLRTTEDNFESLQVLFKEVRNVTTNPASRLTATIAGGRKSMSAMMALAFQLYARKQDELIHIIAHDSKMDPRNPESKTWFYPTNPAAPDEKLEISQIPVIKVGRYLTIDVNQPPEKLIQYIQNDIIENAPIEQLLMDGGTISCGSEKIQLPPKLASYFRYFLKKRIEAKCHLECRGCRECFANKIELLEAAKTKILEEHRLIAGRYNGNYLKTKTSRENANYEQCIAAINEDISRLKAKIGRAKISRRFKNGIQVKSLHFNPNDRKETWYGITINPNAIKFKK